MKRLFVDVDDTLILWSAGTDFATKFEPNEAVIAFARKWRDVYPDGEIIVWSLGGKDYAGEHRRKLLPFAHRHEAKWPRIPEPGDLFLDDDPLPSYRHATLHPHVVMAAREVVAS